MASPDLLVGTYTERLPHVDGHAPGILRVRPNGVVHSVGVTRNPSWIVTTRAGDCVYAVAETREFESGRSGGLRAFRNASGSLLPLNTTSSLGLEPAHLMITHDEKHLVVANYGDGVVSVFALQPEGLIGHNTCIVRHEGASVDPVRQSSAHPHHVAMDPITGEIIVCDLGQDALLVYELTADGRLVERRNKRIAMAPGSGPRHLAFASDGSCVFVVGELDNTLVRLRRGTDRFEATRTWSTVPSTFVGKSAASAIQLSADDQIAYVANRGHESIAVVELESRSPVPRTFVPCGGRTPRDMLLSIEGRLHVANQDSNSLVTFEIGDDGVPQQTRTIEVPTPACVVEIDNLSHGLA